MVNTERHRQTRQAVHSRLRSDMNKNNVSMPSFQTVVDLYTYIWLFSYWLKFMLEDQGLYPEFFFLKTH